MSTTNPSSFAVAGTLPRDEVAAARERQPLVTEDWLAVFVGAALLALAPAGGRPAVARLARGPAGPPRRSTGGARQHRTHGANRVAGAWAADRRRRGAAREHAGLRAGGSTSVRSGMAVAGDGGLRRLGGGGAAVCDFSSLLSP